MERASIALSESSHNFSAKHEELDFKNSDPSPKGCKVCNMTLSAARKKTGQAPCLYSQSFPFYLKVGALDAEHPKVLLEQLTLR